MGKKIFLMIVLFLFLNPFFVFGKEAGESAKITYKTILQEEPKTVFYQKAAIKNILEKYHSPLIGEVDTFIKVCYQYQLDCYLLPSIAGIESTFGQYLIPSSFNPFGWGGGKIFFKNFKEAIEKVASALKNNYIDRGLTTVETIGKVYSESPSWSQKVLFFINQFKKEEENLRLYFEKNTVKL
jgi:hypothetical protein